jgi:hypothetical protein
MTDSTDPTTTPAPLTPAEQAAFEAFGDAWTRLRTVEQALKDGHGASFTHHDALQAMQTAAQAVRAAVLGQGEPLCEPAPAHDGVTLTLPLNRLPSLTADLVHTPVANLLDEACFTVTGEGDPQLLTTAYNLARAASQLLSEEAEIRLYGDALGALTAHLSEHSRALRIRAYELDPDQAHAGWASDDGHLKHGRLKPY